MSDATPDAGEARVKVQVTDEDGGDVDEEKVPSKPSSEGDQEGDISDNESCMTDLSDEAEDHPDQRLRRAITDDDLEGVQRALDAGGNPNRRYITAGIFTFAESFPVIDLLYEHGAAIRRVQNSEETRRLFTGLEGTNMSNPFASLDPSSSLEERKPPSPLDFVTQQQFDEGRARRFGTSNPEKMDIPFWNAMVEYGGQAYDARKKFDSYWAKLASEYEQDGDTDGDEDSTDPAPAGANELATKMADVSLDDKTSETDAEKSKDDAPEESDKESTNPFAIFGGPIWCTARFGETITKLPDGTIVEIGGEHEDHYDPDFLIYNDVIVHGPDFTATGLTGKKIKPYTIYGYPEDVFPPTDFHTATHVPSLNAIFIIGTLGYGGKESEAAAERGETPVYRLDVGTWKITKIDTAGEGPGFICYHEASLEEGDEIRVHAGEVDSWASFEAKRTVVVEGEDGKKKHEEVMVESNESWVLSLANMTWTKEVVEHVPTEREVKRKEKRERIRKGEATRADYLDF